MPKNSAPKPAPNNSPIRFLQLYKQVSKSTGRKRYLARLINIQTDSKRILRKTHPRYEEAQSYACAVANRINRWLEAK